MQKDTIYIDVEDDITSVIGKIKDSDKEIITLIPPKRMGLLHSAVNLRLLQRTAENNGKRLIIVTGNTALASLAAAAQIPVAKTLQSKPELGKPETGVDDPEDDVIDGAELPVGDHAGLSSKEDDEIDEAVDEISADELNAVAGVSAGESVKEASKKPKTASGVSSSVAAKSAVKIPNFDVFRKKMIFILLGAVLLIGLLVWLIIFAPSARIIITAKTTTTAATGRVSLNPDKTDAAAKLMKTATKTIQKDISVPFAATGKKDVGEKAQGKVSFSTNDLDAYDRGVPAGTVLQSSSGAKYVTTEAVTFTRDNRRNAQVTIEAAERGARYNGATGSVEGAPENVNARIVDATAGGTDKTITVVTDADVRGALAKARDQFKDDAMKAELTNQFAKDDVVIADTYGANYDAVRPNIGVDQELGSNQASVAGKATFSIMGVTRPEISSYLDQFFKTEIDGKPNQKVYSNGAKTATLTNFTQASGAFQANISTNGEIGPKIDESDVKSFSKEKTYGEVQGKYETVGGVENVDIKFSPFWVSKVPNDEKRIKVEFILNDAK